jgi:alkylhydroperoxidase/carboxymuconolactone decarboxylase family protein YurZ
MALTMVRVHARAHTVRAVAALVPILLSSSCAKPHGVVTPHAEVQTSMSLQDDVRSVSPALERYRREALHESLWKRPHLSPRDRSIVTVAALIARNQTAEQATVRRPVPARTRTRGLIATGRASSQRP